MTDISTIGIRADITQLQNAVRELNRLADQGQRTETSVTRSMNGISGAFKTLTGTIAAAFSANKIIDYADAWKQANAQIRQVTGSEQELVAVRQRLISLSDDTRTSLETTIQLYSNLDRATESLGVSSENVMGITETINNLFLAGGKSSAAAAAGITQLSQAFASGVLRGDEFNSVAENAPRILDALSAKLGKTRGQLRAMAEDGALTAGILAEALIEYRDEAQKLADTTEKTFGQSMTMASNNMLQIVGTSKTLNTAVDSLGNGIQTVSKEFLNFSQGKYDGYLDAIGERFSWVWDVAKTGAGVVMNALEGLYGLWYMMHNDAMMAMGTTTDDFFREIKDGFTSAPENIKAFIQVLTVEFAALFDKVMAGSRAFYDILTNPLDASATFDAYKREVEGINMAREGSLQAVFDEKAAVEISYDAQIKKANELRAAFDAKNAAAKNDMLGKFGKGGKTEETATEEQLKAAKKLLDLEEKRADAIKDMISDLTRETDLMGETSKEAEIRYDIEHGLIDVLDGINGKEAQSLLNAARLNDEKRKQIELDKQLEDKLADDIMRNSQEAIDAVAEWGETAKREAEEISQSLTDALMRGFESGKGFAQNLKDSVSNMFKTMIIKPTIQPYMNKASEYIQKATGAIPSIVKDVLAVGTIVGSVWNDYMEKDFKELTSEFRQGRQSTGTLLGMANAKSDSISKALSEMGDNGASLLDVNHGMYQALLDIRTGISGSAAGFARQSLGGNAAAGISTGTDFANLADSVGGGFLGAVVNSISKALYSKKTSLIDSGIQIIGGSLADALESGMVGAMNYAEVKTTKKVLGFTTSAKVKTQTSDLNEEFKIQFAKVFEGAGEALEEASQVFGSTFDASKLMIDATKLSLKGLEGDALTKEIESFFSSTLDKWADSLVDGLTQFQEVGEGAFETMVRLASQTNIFTSYAEKLLPKFNLVGMAAITATQAVAELSGGFDRLNTNMSSYYQNFFSESEKSQRGLAQISDALASVGLTMPKTRDEFRAMVESLDLTSEAQQKQYAALLDVNQAFAQFVPAADAVSSATEQLKNDFNAIADQQKSLSAKLFELTASDAEKRQAELDAALSDENRAIQQQIHAALDLADATKKAAGELSDMQSKMAAVAQERYGLETQLLTLQGDTQALRERELATLDASNRPLQEQIWALEEAARVAEESAAAQQRAHEEASRAAQDAADEQARLIKGTQDALTSAIRKLRGESGQLNDLDRQRAKNTLNAALAAAQSGQSIVGFKGLEDAVSKISDLDKSQFVSADDYQRELGRTLSILDRLSGYAGMPSASTNPIISNGALAAQTQTNQQMAANLAAVEGNMEKLAIQIEDNTKRTKMMLERWEAIGMPASRIAV